MLLLLLQSGAIWLTIMLFMAVTSTGSAELIAVSSLFSYDIYRWVTLRCALILGRVLLPSEMLRPPPVLVTSVVQQGWHGMDSAAKPLQ